MKRMGMVLAGGLGRRMGGEKPKVLYEVGGISMVNRALEALRQGGAEDLVAVLSHKADEVSAVLPQDVRLVVQESPRGTGSAVLESQHLLEDEELAVAISFGDMPWINPKSVRALFDALEQGADAAVLTYAFEDPPHFGRIIRDDTGEFVDIVQKKDLTKEQEKINELDAGLFAFRGSKLCSAIRQIDDNNAAGELYLTCAPGKIRQEGGRVVCASAEHIEEALGVNDPHHLSFAQRLGLLRASEEVLEIADDIYKEIVPEQLHPSALRNGGE